MTLLAKLLLAHMLGDFILQPASWVAEKEKHKLASPVLYYHVLLHFALTWLLLWNLKLWWVAFCVAVTHLGIDCLKIYFQKEGTRRRWFFIDQLLHIIVIVVLVTLNGEKIEMPYFIKSWAMLAGLLFLTTPASIVIKTLISFYTPKTELQKEGSLENAGLYIGILERLLIFIFIITNHWEGVGFLIAAKSIFRFSDLSQSKDRKLTEYILIGTLLSFSIAIATAILVAYSA